VLHSEKKMGINGLKHSRTTVRVCDTGNEMHPLNGTQRIVMV